MQNKQGQQEPTLDPSELDQHMDTKELSVPRGPALYTEGEHLFDMVMVGLIMFIAGLVTGVGLYWTKLL